MEEKTKTKWSGALKAAQDCNETITLVEAQLRDHPLPEIPEALREIFGIKPN